MKAITTIITLLLLTLGVTSCSNDNVTPRSETNVPKLEESGGHLVLERPSAPCGAYQTVNLVNETKDIYGNVEIVNDQQFVYFITHLNHGWVITDIKLFTGKHQFAPLKSNNHLDLEKFSYTRLINRWANETSTKIPTGPVANCGDFVMAVKIAQVDWFGSVMSTETLWLDGPTLNDGTYYNYCKSACTPSISVSTGTN